MKYKIVTLRIGEKSFQNTIKALEKYNEENIFTITKSEFMRLAIETFNQLILQGKKIPIEIR